MQHEIKAVVFDVFGTLVDWRGSIAREAQALLAPLAPPGSDWLAFADAWRGEYQGAMEEVRSGRLPYTKLDALHRRNLDLVLARQPWGPRVDEALRQRLNTAWHRLDAWPDVGAALQRLRATGCLLAPCSNGNISLMAQLARHNGWHWDAILGAEIAQDYKPKPGVYLAAAAAFDLPPAQVLMVAAHSYDLAAAAAAGLRTGFTARPDEHGPGTGETTPSLPVDWRAGDLAGLAGQLGA
jgi:2-haloacid dehalogenase